MALRPQHRRPQDFKRGRLVGELPLDLDLGEIAARVRYIADGKHKDYPAPNQEWNYVWNSEGTKCLRISPANWSKLTDLLRRAIRVGMISEEFRGEFPARVWAYINGKLHEARSSSNGDYHGFPLDYEEQHPIDRAGRLQLAPHLEL